jgi:hypothetical protein
MIFALLFMAVGLLLVILSIAASENLKPMFDEEGTESLSAIPFAELGCVSFLMMVGFSGVLLCCYGVHVLRRKRA